MRYLIFALLLMITACTSSSTSSGSMNPITAAGCDVETAVTAGFAGSIATAFTCSNQAAIQSSLQTALGNVNLCAANPSVAAVTSAQITAKKALAKAASPMGIVGSLVCPLAINTIVGFATAQIPTAWGCTASASASDIVAALTTACVAAVPL